MVFHSFCSRSHLTRSKRQGFTLVELLVVHRYHRHSGGPFVTRCTSSTRSSQTYAMLQQLETVGAGVAQL